MLKYLTCLSLFCYSNLSAVKQIIRSPQILSQAHLRYTRLHYQNRTHFMKPLRRLFHSRPATGRLWSIHASLPSIHQTYLFFRSCCTSWYGHHYRRELTGRLPTRTLSWYCDDLLACRFMIYLTLLRSIFLSLFSSPLSRKLRPKNYFRRDSTVPNRSR